MSHQNKKNFINAIRDTKLVNVTYNSKKHGLVTRTYVPLDYGPWQRQNTGGLRYHFYSTSRSGEGHPVSLKPEQIISIVEINKKFSPEYIVHWVPTWRIYRDWGIKS